MTNWRHIVSIGMALALLVGVQNRGAQDCAITVQPGQSLQQAINAVDEGALVCIAAGTFPENITIGKSLTVRGMGRAQTILQGAIRIERDHEIRVTLTALTVTGSRLGAAVRAAARAQVTLDNVAVTESFIGVLAVGSARVALSNSEIVNNQHDGIRAEETSLMSVQGSRISENGLDGIAVRDSATLQLSENVIENNKRCGVRVFAGQVSGTPNMMRGNGADLCGFAPITVRRPLVPQTERSHLTVPGDFQNLQEALDAIAPGGTVSVQNGSYDVGLTIWKPVTVRGTATLRALPTRQLVLSVIADAQDVTLEGLTVTGSRGDGLLLYGQTTLRAVKILNHLDDGAEITGSAAVQFLESVISGNGDDGIFAAERAQLSLADSTISDNGGDGLEARDSVRIQLQKTQVSKNGLRGLEVRIAAQLELAYSRLMENKLDGIALRDSAQATLESAQIWRNGADGALVTDKARATLMNSTLSENSTDGLEVSGAASVELRRTTFQSNGWAEACLRVDQLCVGIAAIGDAQVRLVDSAIKGSADWGIMAWLRRCGATFDFFRGKVTFEGTITIEGNNRSGNHKSNPGTHPFASLPDGQVCLP
ncbi:MAG: right-handed parallel beta-helix repeat-containing protein [Candidatus Bipolaricaulota bacterium]|nr:right-handed parallel beta-helix repeat-containing protein [Candidatus Bipolaricaulota bacterium]MDW8030323.1 right-handed parallel beta-helix repeat-containing protein [Candidatus Bipolaricaulota bacterium]